MTFDKEGVSGHRNHISCSAIQPISNIRVLHLESVSILRKFTATIDLGQSYDQEFEPFKDRKKVFVFFELCALYIGQKHAFSG